MTPPTEEELRRVLPEPWQIVPRRACRNQADEEPCLLVAAPESVTAGREELEQSFCAALSEDRLQIVARVEKKDV